MFDPVQYQLDLVGVLASDQRLAAVAVKSYRKMRLDSEIDYRKILEGRGPGGPVSGRTGSGILVPMPVASCRNPDVTGPVLDWDFPVVSIEQPAMSFMPQSGTLLSAEDLAQTVLDILQHYGDDKVGVLYSSPNSVIQPEKEYVFPGCIAYRTTLHVVGKSLQTPRVPPVHFLLADAGGGNKAVTLTCAMAGVRIKVTTDGSFPSDDLAGNSSSVTYTDVLVLPIGTAVRTAAYAPQGGYLNSMVRYITIT
jgi:hypothetical protein